MFDTGDDEEEGEEEVEADGEEESEATESTPTTGEYCFYQVHIITGLHGMVTLYFCLCM